MSHPSPDISPPEGSRPPSSRPLLPALYFCLVFLGLFLLHRQSFRNPPRSDYWSAFYVFQQLDASPEPLAWTGVFTFDLWQHGTYRPLSHFIPYLQHRLFSPRFVWNHITNFAAYCFSIILLYRLAAKLSLDRRLAAVFLTVFAFLYSHSDLLTWTFQLFTILGFCAFLLGFLLHLEYLATRRRLLPLAVGALFLFGMLCSELFALWPLAVLILPFAVSPRKPRLERRDAAPLLVYLPYLAGLWLHRAGTATTGPVPLPSLSQAGTGFLLVFFNLAYTGFAVNLWPALARPVFYDDNINMGGRLLDLAGPREPVFYWAGGVVLLLLVLAGWVLIRSKRFRLADILAFFFFLYLTGFLTVSVARQTTNLPIYTLSQFRYQYIPNALLALALTAVVGGLFKPRVRRAAIIALILAPVLVFNIVISQRQVADLGERLRPLGIMLENIRRGLEEGKISEGERLYIAPDVPDRVPPPGWNRSMARFMEGNFHWFFPARQMGKFTLDPDEAVWVITEGSFPELRRREEKRRDDRTR